MKAGELRALDNEELLSRIDELQKSLFNLRLRNVTKELDNTSQLRVARQDIARVKTVLRERKVII